MPQQQTLPTFLALNACNDTTAQGLADLRTGQPYYAGLNNGDYFDLTNEEANQLSYQTNGVLYAGRYRRVLVDSGATAANVKTGTIGVMPSLAVVAKNAFGTKNPPMNIVTSYDQSIGGGSIRLRPVVFLNAVTPGNYCFVQELGVASVLGGATITNNTPAIGQMISVASGGVVDSPSGQSNVVQTVIGNAIDLPAAKQLFRILLSNVPICQG